MKQYQIEFATVDELIKILQRVSENGKGDYIVRCNDEYWLASKGEIPIANERDKIVDIGGYL